MKYVKLIAKPDTWFKAGTEVYDYDCHPPHYAQRVTSAGWEKAKDSAYSGLCIGVRGMRVCDNPTEAKNLNVAIGEEYWDGEWCHIDEFEATIVEESK